MRVFTLNWAGLVPIDMPKAAKAAGKFEELHALLARHHIYKFVNNICEPFDISIKIVKKLTLENVECREVLSETNRVTQSMSPELHAQQNELCFCPVGSNKQIIPAFAGVHVRATCAFATL